MAIGDKKPVVMESDLGVPSGVATLGKDGLLSESQRPPTEDAIPLEQKGVAGGVAELDDNGLIPEEQLPLQEFIPQEVDEDWDAVMAEEDAAAAQTAPVSAPRKLPAAATAALAELKELKKYLGRAGFRQAVRRIKGDLAAKADKRAVDAELAKLKERPYSNPNLLDNWYFVGGGSQQGGGQFPVNQRTEMEYTGAGYTADRWYNMGAFRVTLQDVGMKIECILPTNRNFWQPIENPSHLFNKQVTASILIAECHGNGYLALVQGGLTFKSVSFSSPGLYSFTYDVPPSLTRMEFKMGAKEIGDYIVVKAVKLELGPVQTLAHKEGDNWVLNDPPPNYALELAKCQRYFIRLTGQGNTQITNTIMAAQSSNNYANVTIPLPVSMRANPTVVMKDLAYFISGNENSTINIPDDGIVFAYCRENSVYLNFNIAGIGAGDKTLFRGLKFNTDKSCLDLSADL